MIKAIHRLWYITSEGQFEQSVMWRMLVMLPEWVMWQQLVKGQQLVY
jgi:hypothetical protein